MFDPAEQNLDQLLLTGSVIDPLDVRWRVFLKIPEHVLCAHVVHARHVDGLQAQSGDGWAPQKKKINKHKEDGSRFSESCSSTFFHNVFIQKNVPLTDALLAAEMETSGSLLFPLDGLLTKTRSLNTSLSAQPPFAFWETVQVLPWS